MSEIGMIDKDLDDPYATDDGGSDYKPESAGASSTTTQNIESASNISDTFSDLDVETEITSKAKKSTVLHGTFFKIVKVEDVNHIQVECVSCKPKKCILKGSSITTTNFIKHLKKMHPNNYTEYLSYKANKNRKRKLEKFKVQDGEQKKKKSDNRSTQQNIKSYFNKPNSKSVSQNEFDKRILKFVVKTMVPMSIVEHADFISMFEGFNVEVLSRRTLVRKITELSDKREIKLKNTLSNVKYVCSTAEIWSGKRKSFFGVTCHWIDSDFERHSVALCCKRFKGVHSYDRIVDMLEDVHVRFGLDLGKITATITDNGSNFVKSFKEFGLQNFTPYVIDIEADGEETETDDEVLDDEDEIQFAEINFDNLEYRLPRHLRCASHTLNLICTTDVAKVINANANMRSRHANVISKCSVLWKKAALPKFSDIIKETLGHTLSYPGQTRWNSFFDSLKQILNSREKLPELYENLDLKSGLNANEILYMEEYCEILEPVAATLDVLQGEKNTYYGILIPCLCSLKNKLEKLKRTQFKQAGKLVDACLDGLLRRFDSFFKLEKSVSDAVVAAVVHPRFKLKWFDTAKKTCESDIDINYIQKLIIDEGIKFVSPSENSTEDDPQNDDDFFDFDDLESASTSQPQPVNSVGIGTNMKNKNRIELEFLRYLEDSRSTLSMLNDYSIIKKIFICTNTPLPSSAPVERLFSYATIINALKRNALSDTNFENLVLLKNYI